MVVLAALTASLLQPAWAAAAPESFDDPAWRAAAHERFNDTDVYLLEDGTYLYVDFSAQHAAADDGDAVTLYLWSDRSKYAFTVDAHGVRSAFRSSGTVPEWSAQERERSGGYEVVMRVPEALFASSGQSRWLVQFARVVPGKNVAYTWPESSGAPGNVMYAGDFDARAAGRFSAAPAASNEPKVLAATRVSQVWRRTALAAPAIPTDAQGVAVSQTHDNFHFAGVDAKSKDGSVQDAQSLDWSSGDRRTSAGVQRVANASGAAYDVTQALSLAYDNQQNMRFSAGVAADRGTNVDDASQANYNYYDFSLYGKRSTFDMRWDFVGPEYTGALSDAPAPGTTGYTLSLSRAVGNVSVDASADRYRDDLGNLAYANERARISAALSPAFTFDVDAAENAATQYTALPFAQTGAELDYAADGRQGSLAYREDRYQGGLARELSITGGVPVPLLGMLQFAHRQTSTSGFVALTEPQQSDSASLLHRVHDGSVSVGYQYAGGASNVTFSFEDRLPIGLLRATYYKPNTIFAAPNFSLKLLTL